MTKVLPAVDFKIHRIELHADGGDTDGSEAPVWALNCAMSGDIIFLFGYLRARSAAGFGQTQVVAMVGKHRIDGFPTEQDAVEDWLRIHVAEGLYDLARRTLSAQAASMDFSLELPYEAPSFELEFDEDSDGEPE